MPPGIFYHIPIRTLCTAVIYSYCYVHSVPPLELRGWVRRLYLRITIFDADEHWGVVVSPGSSVTKEDLSCKHWKHWNGMRMYFLNFTEICVKNIISSLLLTAVAKELGISINYSSACLGQINCGRNGRRRGGAEKRRRLRRRRRKKEKEGLSGEGGEEGGREGGGHRKRRTNATYMELRYT